MTAASVNCVKLSEFIVKIFDIPNQFKQSVECTDSQFHLLFVEKRVLRRIHDAFVRWFQFAATT